LFFQPETMLALPDMGNGLNIIDRQQPKSTPSP